MLLLFQKFIAYGMLGLLVEVLFTGLWSLWHRNWRATAQTYLWMLPIYGGGALVFDWLHHLQLLAPLWMAFIYTLLIYLIEFTSGWVLEKLTGKCPWHYGFGRHTIMGYVRLDYAPFWFALSVFFVFLAPWMQRLFSVINTVL